MSDLRKFILSETREVLDIVSKVDTTLPEENIPADSKTVGNKLADLDAKIADLESTSNVFNANTHFDFPSVGSVNMIYKAYKEKKTYQWNAEELRYEALDVDILEDISVINGGAANG